MYVLRSMDMGRPCPANFIPPNPAIFQTQYTLLLGRHSQNPPWEILGQQQLRKYLLEQKGLHPSQKQFQKSVGSIARNTQDVLVACGGS